MGRPNTLEQKRRDFLPVVAAAFAELGYRRLTSAELAARCGVGENVLYRIWPDKQAMFLAALDWVYLDSERTWKKLLEEPSREENSFLRLLAYEAVHHGEQRLYRIVFAGLSETDDRRIAQALRDLYGRFQAFVRSRIAEHRDAGAAGAEGRIDLDTAAWAIVGLGTVANIGRELGLLGAEPRRALIEGAGRLLAEGRSSSEARGASRKHRKETPR
jgi:AcrR family transcriptional regulator